MGIVDPTAQSDSTRAGGTTRSGGGAALNPDGARVSLGFTSAFTGASLGTWLALMPATQVTLALRVQQLAPEHKAGVLSLVLAVGSAVALVAQNIFGALSDRTTSQFGMRRPWIAAGAVLGMASLGLLATASTVALVVLAWALTQLTFNILLAGLNPVLPDQVPSRQMGRHSAIVGLSQQVGIAGGAFLAQLFMPNLMLAILAPGLLCLLGAGVFLLVLRDRRLAPADRQPLRPMALVRAFWVNPRTHPDFAWAWLSRFLVMFGNFTFSNYLTYFLMDRFDYGPDKVATLVSEVLLMQVSLTVVAGIGCSAFSDRLQRRKLFVLLAGMVLALAHVLAAFSPSLAVFFAASGIGGLAMGCYLAVDLALIAEVLPSRTTAGKDMGVFHLANVLPQTLVPALAPAFLAIGGQKENYAAYFIAGAIAAIVGALCNQRIRAVR